MDERDLRQLKKMREQIKSYIDGYIGLQSLIGDLIFLRDVLSEVDKKWEHKFTEKIIDLESVNCYLLGIKFGNIGPDKKKIVDDSLIELVNLIKKKEGN